MIFVGDYIEKIDGKSLVGCRYFEVVKMLKDILKGIIFIIRVVEFMKLGFCKFICIYIYIRGWYDLIDLSVFKFIIGKEIWNI